jgi:hypothetical protein
MTSLILFVLATIGLTSIMVSGTIMSPVRTFLKNKLPARVYEVFDCYQCMGTWCGFVCGILTLSDYWLGLVLLYGFAGSFVANVGCTIFDMILMRTALPLPDDTEHQ